MRARNLGVCDQERQTKTKSYPPNKTAGIRIPDVGVFYYCTRAVKQGGISAADLERYKNERAIQLKKES